MDKNRAKMPPGQRAKQFVPFDAVVGLRQALKEKEKIRVPKKELTDSAAEELDLLIRTLKIGDTVSITFYDCFEQKYHIVTEKIIKINVKTRTVELENISIPIDNIYNIE